MQTLLKTEKGISKKELIEYLQNRKDIPDYSEFSLTFDDIDRKFVVSFYWSEKNIPAVFGEDVVEISNIESEDIIKDVFALSV